MSDTANRLLIRATTLYRQQSLARRSGQETDSGAMNAAVRAYADAAGIGCNEALSAVLGAYERIRAVSRLG